MYYNIYNILSKIFLRKDITHAKSCNSNLYTKYPVPPIAGYF